MAALISSPALRCVQSLEPLADRLAMKVEVDDRLVEGSALEDVLALVGEAADGTVLCSHGDVVPELIAALVRRGRKLVTEPDWRKATLWVLDGETVAVEPPTSSLPRPSVCASECLPSPCPPP